MLFHNLDSKASHLSKQGTSENRPYRGHLILFYPNLPMRLFLLLAASLLILPACDSSEPDPTPPPVLPPVPVSNNLSGTYRGEGVIPNSGGLRLTLAITAPNTATGATFSFTATGSVSNGTTTQNIAPFSGIGEYNFPTVRFTDSTGDSISGTVAAGGASIVLIGFTFDLGQGAGPVDVPLTLTRT